MPEISQTADLEAEIDALIRQAGERLRQMRENLHGNHAAKRGTDQASKESWPEPVRSDLAGDFGPTADSERRDLRLHKEA